jgi:hypothetical protein
MLRTLVGSWPLLSRSFTSVGVAKTTVANARAMRETSIILNVERKVKGRDEGVNVGKEKEMPSST